MDEKPVVGKNSLSSQQAGRQQNLYRGWAFYPEPAMTPEQCRAARGWLGWSQHELARRASVAKNTIHEFEIGRRRPTRNNIAAIQRALETAGISLLFDMVGDARGIEYRVPNSE
jgi:DNA-binding transcriptional regulator YiaG